MLGQTPEQTGRLRITRGWLLRVAASVTILAALLWYLPTDRVLAGFRAVGWSLFALVLALFMVGHAVAAAKWWVLLGRGFPYLAALRAHFAGLAANLCLPGVAGGDVARAAIVSRYKPIDVLTAGSLGDRLIDMLALALLAATGLLMLNGAGQIVLVVQVLVLFGVAVLGAFYVFPALMPLIAAKIPGLPAREMLEKMARAFGDLGRRPGTLLLALISSSAIQAGFIWLTILLAQATGIDAPTGAWFFAWPLAKILAVLPISLGGIGVREASLSGLMLPFGVEAAAVVAASLIWQAVLIAAGLIGAVAWGLSPVRKEKLVESVE